MLSWAIAAGDWPATEDQAAQVVEAHQSWMATTVLLERLLLRTARSFDDHGIPFQVLKGSAVAHLDYEDPSLRCFGDVDLLIPGSHIEAARDLLLAEGAGVPTPSRDRGSIGASPRAWPSPPRTASRSTSTARSPRVPSAWPSTSAR